MTNPNSVESDDNLINGLNLFPAEEQANLLYNIAVDTAWQAAQDADVDGAAR